MKQQNTDYKNWLSELKGKIRSVQIKAAIAVNSELIQFYWMLGKMISEKQSAWGSRFVETLSKDLQDEFPEMKGFSVSNLKTCKLFYAYFSSPLLNQNEISKLSISSQPVNQLKNDPQLEAGILQLPVIQIPWGHTKIIITKIKDRKEADFYIWQTIENNWSRDVLAFQIKSNLYERSGKAVTNFKATLPDPLSELAQQTLKDPYVFDFMTMTKPFVEKDIENQLVKHVTKFLLELGKGFAFVGQQYHLKVSESDYYIDLLFYHTRLKCYVVIELKNRKFMPEFVGKLNFYLSAVDSLIKQADDNSTIGILLCRDKDNIETEFALRDIKKPMGVSEFEFTEVLPENLRSSLPTIEEIENELRKIS